MINGVNKHKADIFPTVSKIFCFQENSRGLLGMNIQYAIPKSKLSFFLFISEVIFILKRKKFAGILIVLITIYHENQLHIKISFELSDFV